MATKNLITLALVSIAFFFLNCSCGKKNNNANIVETNMENINCWMNPQTIVKCNAHSGNFACVLNKDVEYGFGYLNSFENIGKVPKWIFRPN